MTELLLDELSEYEAELFEPYADKLDFRYVVATAATIAESLADEIPAGVCFQPGDGTAYRLVFTPLWSMEEADPRVVDGVAWTGRAVEGLGDDPFGSVLISWVEHGCFPLALRRAEGRSLAASYIGEKLREPGASSVTLAMLFREVARQFNALA